jgi:hypothetical protein
MDGSVPAAGGLTQDGGNPLPGFKECDVVAFQEFIDRNGTNLSFRYGTTHDGEPLPAYYDLSEGTGKAVMVAYRMYGTYYIAEGR